MICKKCGAVVPDDDIICPECGGLVDSKSAQQHKLEQASGLVGFKYYTPSFYEG